ncbi:hypothetical protein V865_000599 [Kwoniella europaea PYCC6329]|uniref:Uncharacterized protein n=1 Tax=Kwoniella europaea PYCC6329 TaxID=1423913 RepID=A0AAX4K8M7_9TREE
MFSRQSSHLYEILSFLALAQIAVGAVFAPRDDSLPTLCDDKGLAASIYHENINEWDTSWLGATLGAFARADQDTLKKMYSVDGKPVDKCDAKYDKATFRLTKTDGEIFEKEIAYNDCPVETDWEKNNWLVSGFEAAAIQMGGYLGLNADSITYGDPTDAYYMISGKRPVIDHFSEKNPNDDTDKDKIAEAEEAEKKRMFELLKKCGETPIIVGTGADPDDRKQSGNLREWTWYTITSVIEGDGQDYKDSKILFWHAQEEREVVFKFSSCFDDLRKVVHFE